MGNDEGLLKNNAGKDVLVVGIDFGTTYSGAAWATSAEYEKGNVKFIVNWPGHGGDVAKTPTELYYDDDIGEVVWGYDIPPDVEPLRWFKLLLLKDRDLSQEMRASDLLQRSRAKLRALRKSAVDVIADYLRALWEHTLETITKEHGQSWVNKHTIHVVVTVPAIWKGYARQSMEEAVRKAGILDSRSAGPTLLGLAPEPEAAALSTLLERSAHVNKGDVYIVCDAGGGTVDLITYEIESTDSIRMREAVPGTGGLCGGVFVDKAFEEKCKDRLDQRWSKLTQAGVYDIMKKEWEYGIKSQFNAKNKSRTYFVTLPPEACSVQSLDDTTRQPYIKGGRIHFKVHDLQPVFDGVFSKILALIEDQKNEAVKKGLKVTGLILVGGLGGSPYLYQFMDAKLGGPDFIVLQGSGKGPRLAICHGAVLKGFLDGVQSETNEYGTGQAHRPIEITSTIARANYGIVFFIRYNEALHLEEDKVWHAEEGEYKAENQMEWYLRKGDCVSKSSLVSHAFYRLFRDNWDGKFTQTLYQCEDDIPPTRQTANVEQMCTLSCSLAENMRTEALIPFESPEGGELKKLRYKIKMIPCGNSVDFEVECKGKRLGCKNLDIKFLTSNSL